MGKRFAAHMIIAQERKPCIWEVAGPSKTAWFWLKWPPKRNPMKLLLFRYLALTGCIVTIDAMGTQTKIAAQIIEQDSDYALALKDNQGTLYEEVKATLL